MEIRPVFGPLPCSATNKLPLVEKIILMGELRPFVRTETGHCASATLLANKKTVITLSAADVK
jgi:hypothetical protein